MSQIPLRGFNRAFSQWDRGLSSRYGLIGVPLGHDITSDSDGDGDPANDVDYTGRWIEFSYDSGGSKKAKLTVLDDSSSHSVTMDLQVAEAPVSFSEELTSNIVPIIFTLIVVSAGAWVLIRNPRKSRSEEEKKASDIDFDAAFDEPRLLS